MFMDVLCKLLQSSSQGQNERMILRRSFQVLGLIYVLHCRAALLVFFKIKLALSVKFFYLSKQIPLNPENQAIGYNR